MSARYINGLSDSYKAKQITMLVQSGSRFSQWDLQSMVDSSSDSYKQGIVAACKPGLRGTLSEEIFFSMCDGMSDSYKQRFARECLNILPSTISASAFGSCLSGMADSYKKAFADVIAPKVPNLQLVMRDILSECSDSYKSALVCTCANHFSGPVPNLVEILGDCADSYKAGVVNAFGRMAQLSERKMVVILDDTSSSYQAALHPCLLSLLQAPASQARETKTSKQHTEIPEVSDNFMSEKVLNFMSDVVQAAVKNLAGSSTPQEQRQSSAPAQCVVCLDALAEWAIVPCGHKVCCEVCGKAVQACPMCRGRKDMVMKVFDA